MQPPTTIRVGPMRWNLIMDRVAIKSVDIECNGVTAKEQGRITVDPERHPDAVAETVLHEVLHAISCANGNRKAKMDEHDWIYATSPLLLDTLRRNPDLVAYLTAEN